MMRSLIAGFCTLVAALTATASDLKKPNLIAIVTDDQALWTLGCYGGKELPTPNLDRLAAEGVRFSNAFVHTPVCSPSRAMYMTGRFGTELGFTDWLTPEQAKTRGVTTATPTWPSVLAANGYATALVGKWHLGERNESLPWNNGVMRFTGNLSGGWNTKKIEFITEKGAKVASDGFSVDLCTDLAMAFMDEHRDAPFALLVHYREPHADYTPMPELDMQAAKAANIKVPDYPGIRTDHVEKARRNYYASIAAIDRSVGRLLTHLDEAGLADNTIVVFTSDHGYNIGEHGIQHKGNAVWITEGQNQTRRPNMFDTSLRVPLLMRTPAIAQQQELRGRIVEEWVTNADMFATTLGLLGVAKPESMPKSTRDFSAALRGEKLPAEKFQHELFGQYDLINAKAERHMRMIRTERWKLVLHLNAPQQHELYDLEADPGERTNMFGRAGTEDATSDLTAQLRERMTAIRDPRVDELR